MANWFGNCVYFKSDHSTRKELGFPTVYVNPFYIFLILEQICSYQGACLDNAGGTNLSL